jgi:histidine triad (HIT) family protein
MDCIFCKIIKGEIPCTKVYEDENILCFLDIAPANKGHCLIVPKEHYEILIDAPEDIINYSLKVAKKIARAMSASLANEGFNVLINNGKAAGQIVPHVHLHVIPRFKGDGVSLKWTPKRYKENEIQEFADKINKFL